MYCPECGGNVINGVCVDCKYTASKELLALNSVKEVNKNDRKASLIAYVFWPLIMTAKYENAKTVNFHKNQGFTLFIVEILSALAFLVPNIGAFVGGGLSIACLFLIYQGIMNVLHEEKKKLPVIGDFTFLKE